MKLIILSIPLFLLLGCTTHQSSASGSAADSTQSKSDTYEKPGHHSTLPPNTARVVLTFSETLSSKSDSLTNVQITVRKFIQSGSATPPITSGKEIRLKINSEKLRTRLHQLTSDTLNRPFEATIHYSPTITLSSDDRSGGAWSLLKIDPYQQNKRK